MIVIKKTTHVEKEQCNACGGYSEIQTQIKTSVSGSIFGVLQLCPTCVREITKALTSNQYALLDNYEEEINHE